jgi:hypothetical protein
MICFAKPGLTEDLNLKQKGKHVICAILDKRPSIFISDNPIFSSERMLHKDYNHKGPI